MKILLALFAEDNWVKVSRDFVIIWGLYETYIYAHLLDMHKMYESQGKLVNDDEGEWFYATSDDIKLRCGVGRAAQDTAINNLCKKGVLSQKLKGMPAKRHFSFPESALNIIENQLQNIVENKQTSLSKTNKQVCRKQANKFVENKQTSLSKNDSKQELNKQELNKVSEEAHAEKFLQDETLLVTDIENPTLPTNDQNSEIPNLPLLENTLPAIEETESFMQFQKGFSKPALPAQDLSDQWAEIYRPATFPAAFQAADALAKLSLYLQHQPNANNLCVQAMFKGMDYTLEQWGVVAEEFLSFQFNPKFYNAKYNGNFPSLYVSFARWLKMNKDTLTHGKQRPDAMPALTSILNHAATASGSPENAALKKYLTEKMVSEFYEQTEGALKKLVSGALKDLTPISISEWLYVYVGCKCSSKVAAEVIAGVEFSKLHTPYVNGITTVYGCFIKQFEYIKNKAK